MEQAGAKSLPPAAEEAAGPVARAQGKRSAALGSRSEIAVSANKTSTVPPKDRLDSGTGPQETAPTAEEAVGRSGRARAGIERSEIAVSAKMSARRALLQSLRHDLAIIERQSPGINPSSGQPANPVAPGFGIAEIDAALGARGLPAAALHEIRCAESRDAAAATGFALALAGRLTGFAGTLFWITTSGTRRETGQGYGPGLVQFGLDPARLVHIAAGDIGQAMWAAGEIAAAPGAFACLVELPGNPKAAGLAFTRQLALAARGSGKPALLLRLAGAEEASAAHSRWAVGPARDAGSDGLVGPPAWQITLEKCRGGKPGRFTLQWRKDERAFTLCRPAIPHGDAGPDATGPESPPGAGAALSGAASAEAFDRPDRKTALGAGLAQRRAS